VGEYQRAGHYGSMQEIPFTDGVWRRVTVRGKGPDAAGGWRVLLEWYDGSTTHQDWVVYDSSRFREPRPDRSTEGSRFASD
jgi:hypothetical protein